MTDTGEGMDEATLARAMEPFFTTKGVGKGTGLGLPMVHGIAEQSGGRLILRSRRGEGTTAQLWLPVAAEGGRAASLESQPISPLPARGPQPLVVLAVDDDSLVLLNTVAMLEDLGHTALAAASGQQALDILRQEARVDLLIVDQAMPHMTGTQLAAAVKVEWPDLPMILATGYAELPPGTNPVLQRLNKPFRQSDLTRALAEALQARQGASNVTRLRAR